MQRIAIVGTTGSGKSTLAQQLGQRCQIPIIELDALFWGPNWTPTPRDLFRAQVVTALRGDAWVVGGNYSAAQSVVWTRADTLVWLDYPLGLVLWRLLNRTLRRVVYRQALWNGNRETWRAQFLSRDSLFVWALKSHKRYQREFPKLLLSNEYAHLDVVRLHNAPETARWLGAVQCESFRPALK